MLAINFDPFPVLQTSRLILRRPALRDAPEIFAMRSDPECMRFVPRPLVSSREDAINHLELIDSKIRSNEGINWAVTLRDDDRMIGLMGIYRLSPEDYRGEIGYMIHPEFAGTGLTTEAVGEIVRYGFEELKLNSIEGIIDPRNHASARVLEKNAFRKEAHLRENIFWNGEFLDSVIYAKLASDQ